MGGGRCPEEKELHQIVPPEGEFGFPSLLHEVDSHSLEQGHHSKAAVVVHSWQTDRCCCCRTVVIGERPEIFRLRKQSARHLMGFRLYIYLHICVMQMCIFGWVVITEQLNMCASKVTLVLQKVRPAMEYQSTYRYKRTRNVYNIEGEQTFDAVSCLPVSFVSVWSWMAFLDAVVTV